MNVSKLDLCYTGCPYCFGAANSVCLYILEAMRKGPSVAASCEEPCLPSFEAGAGVDAGGWRKLADKCEGVQ